eukprot:58554-Pyramimonas_sp.AAC.1
MTVRVPRLGALLEPSWGPLRLSWRPLGGLLGHLGAVLGASWPVLERREADKARTPKSFKKLTEIDDFCSLVPFLKSSGRPL